MGIRHLRPSGTETVLRLCGAAGWNQTAADIARLLALEPDGCFAAWEGGRLVGTTTTTAYGTDLAWIGMVLVDPDYRRRGIATALMETALAHLRGRGVVTIQLDATPAGQFVYQRLGFEAERALERWAGTLPAGRVEAVAAGTWEEVAQLDRRAFGADRGELVRAMIAHAGPPVVARNARHDIVGYALGRPGTRAGYIGPVIADDPSTARNLFLAARAAAGENVYVDVDPGFPGGLELLGQLGFARQRELLRMRLGPEVPVEGPPRVFAIAGPEVG